MKNIKKQTNIKNKIPLQTCCELQPTNQMSTAAVLVRDHLVYVMTFKC